MFKRANKITALLVAAASVMSVVPAMASERLGTKEGTINYGIAFDGGKYIYDGYRTDDDNTGIYYNGGDKDKLVDDLEDYTFDNSDYAVKYGKKYALAKDGTDEYLVDLATGKTVDDETDEEKRDTIQGKLRSTLKKTDRYSSTEDFSDVTVESRLFGGNDQFGDVWYMYTAKGDENYTDATTGDAVAAKVTVNLPSKGTLTDATPGKYSVKIGGVTYKLVTTATADNEFAAGIDATETLNNLGSKVADQLKAYLTGFNTSDGKSIFVATPVPSGSEVVATAADKKYTLTESQINNINTKFGANSVNNAVTETTTSTAVQYTGFVNEDGKYIDASNLGNIYAYSKHSEKVVKIEEYNDYDEDDQIIADLVSIKPIAQDKDYIYTITTVNIGQGLKEEDAKAALKSGKGNDFRQAYFYQKIAKAQGDKKDQAYIPKTVDSYEIADKSFYDDGDADDAYKAIIKDDDGYTVEDTMYTVKDGTLYVVRVKDDKVKVFKMKTKKVKADAADSALSSGIVKKDEKLDAPLVQKDADGDHDIFDGAGKNAVSIDVDGNVWALDKGSIYKVDGTDFKEVYTLDRSIDNLDVYNDGSLIAWERDGDSEGDVYTTVTEGKAVTDTEAPAATPAKVGWDKLADGTWNFYDATGAKVVNNWANAGGAWYFLKADGVMATGWQQVGGTWYDLASSGAMKTGWANENGTWYLLASSGAMKTGWVNDNGTWYYLNANGSMAANTTVDGYVLNGSGAWVK